MPIPGPNATIEERVAAGFGFTLSVTVARKGAKTGARHYAYVTPANDAGTGGKVWLACLGKSWALGKWEVNDTFPLCKSGACQRKHEEHIKKSLTRWE